MPTIRKTEMNWSQRCPRRKLGHPLVPIHALPPHSIPIHRPIQAGQKRNVHLQLFGLKDVDTYRFAVPLFQLGDDRGG